MVSAKPVTFLLLSVLVSSCVGTELDVPTNHPGHPRARVRRLEHSTAFASLDTLPRAERADRRGEHAGHQHGAVAPERPTTPEPAPASATYTCPMHPEILRKEPGHCPICGMQLVPKKDGP